MTGFDQSQSARLGQSSGVETTVVTMFDGTDIPESSWDGRLIYRTDRKVLQVYRDTTGAYEDVLGGTGNVLTFVGPTVPVSANANDVWYNTADHYKLYIALSAGSDAITTGEWTLAQDSYTAAQAAAAAQSSANTAQSTATTAQGTANTAQSAANTAQTTANSAASAAAAVSTAAISDGSPPPQVTGVVIQGGVKTVIVRFPAVTNTNPVTYRIYGHTTTGFTPATASLLVETRSTSTVIDRVYNGTTYTTPLVPGTNYYFRVIAVDGDGPGTASAEAVGTPAQITTADIIANAITANELAANAVTAAKINANAVTATSIASGAIDGKTITGALIRTKASGLRWEMSTPSYDQLIAYSGQTSEISPARVYFQAPTPQHAELWIQGMNMAGPLSGTNITAPIIALQTNDDTVPAGREGLIVMSADRYLLSGRLKLNNVGSELSTLDFGTWSGTTNASGQIDCAHNMVVTPAAVMAIQVTGSTAIIRNVAAANTFTTFQLIFVNPTTGSAYGAGVVMSGRYIAMA